IIDGVGGTGVVTIGAVLGMAAHLEDKGCGMIDMAGLAQKGGSVFTHVRIAQSPDDIHAIRVSAGKADLVLGCDLVVSGAQKVLAAVREGQAVAMNVSAFRWGRRAAHQPDFVRGLVAQPGKTAQTAAVAETLDDIIARRVAFLTAYQSAAYGKRYADRLAALRKAEAKAVPGSTNVTEAAARNLFKLMAIKDEYEVARLYTDGSFAAELGKQFQSYDSLEFHLAPPIMGRRGKDGKPRKSSFGPWMMKGFRLLAAMKGLRGTVFDVFGYSTERRMERQLLVQYEADLELVAAALAPGKVEAAAALASVPALIRGYGHVRQASAEKAAGERQRLL
ncbi:MAG: hypothetical protein E5Y69_14990, partial [Mesorhizobium sp.]